MAFLLREKEMSSKKKRNGETRQCEESQKKIRIFPLPLGEG